MRLFLACLGILFLTGSCVDIFDELILHADGSGTYKYSINLSASKVKINSVLALDSLNGKRVPKIPEIKEKIAAYVSRLESKNGISNVQADCNYNDFVFKFSCDFTNLNALQTAIREVVTEESKDRSKIDVSENWMSWDGEKLVRSVPAFESPLHRLKGEDQEALKNGKYIVVSRFDKPVLKSENPSAKVSPSKTAVLLQTSPYAVAQSPGVLKNVITVAQ
jgi:hypothetical protein